MIKVIDRKMASILYVTGVFDGEGCVCITDDPDNRLYLRLSIVKSSARLCDWLKEHFGGNYTLQKDWRRKAENYRPLYTWCLSGTKAQDFLKLVLPFLIVKKETRAQLHALNRPKR